MATIAGNFYKITYQIVTPNAQGTTNPPTLVSAIAFALVNAATAAAAVIALAADIGLTGSQFLSIQNVQQQDLYASTCYQ
jgi:uncharacterized membrane protein